jgi:hypothetical protein
VRLGTFELMRVWAALTGLVLAAWFLGALWLGDTPSPVVPMLVTAIGGFELALYGCDLWFRRKRRHG